MMDPRFYYPPAAPAISGAERNAARGEYESKVVRISLYTSNLDQIVEECYQEGWRMVAANTVALFFERKTSGNYTS